MLVLVTKNGKITEYAFSFYKTGSFLKGNYKMDEKDCNNSKVQNVINMGPVPVNFS